MPDKTIRKEAFPPITDHIREAWKPSATEDGIAHEFVAAYYWRRYGSSTDNHDSTTIESVHSLENDNFQSKTCADQLKALSEPIRLRIVDILRHGEMTVGDISAFLETELVTVSHHLKILKNAGLIEVERDGRFMVYRLRKDLLQKVARTSKEFLNLGCCRIEVPETKPE